jgi:signal transduction histidine kinase
LDPKLRKAAVAQDGSDKFSTNDEQSGSAESIQRASFLLKCRVAGLTILTIVVIATLVGTVILEQRSAALARTHGNVANLSAAFEEQVRRTLDNAAGAMDLLKARIESQGAAFDLSEWAGHIPQLAASTLHVSIIDAEGRLAAATLDPDSTPADLSGNEHFRAHRDNPNAGLIIGKPVRGRVASSVTIEVSKRIGGDNGGFGGVLVFSLDPEFLTSLHRNVDLGQTGSMALIGSDAVIRARYTSTVGLDTGSVGSTLTNARVPRAWTADASGGYVSPSEVDGLTRVYHWRTVAGYPLFVIVGLGKDEALAAANGHAKMVLAEGALALCLPLIMMLILNREIGRRVDREIALRREGEKLRAAHESLTVQHGELLDASAALALERMKLTKANAELALANRQAEEASGAKSSFLANMSHELRTPLNAIIGFAEIIRDQLFGDNPARYSECAADIQISGVHLLRIINGVLDFAKMEAGKVVLHESVINLETAVDESLATVRPQAANGGITLIDVLPRSGIHLQCDETRFKQILINLLSNAIKFTPPGGTVMLNCELEDGALMISVSDTGIGMSAEEIAGAFEPFRQVESPLARRFPGTGLGLPLAVQLSELHGAALDLESTPGVGTTVRVRVPPERVIERTPAILAAQTEDERRIAHRAPVTQLVFIYSDEERFETRTVDLSETGVRVERIAGLMQGDRVHVEIGPHVAEGIVVWLDPTHIGVKFLEGDPAGNSDHARHGRSRLHNAA